jgi:hypothetical protein
VQHGKKMSCAAKIIVKEFLYFPDFCVRLLVFPCYTTRHFVLEFVVECRLCTIMSFAGAHMCVFVTNLIFNIFLLFFYLLFNILQIGCQKTYVH